MSRYYGGWAPYVPVGERLAKAEREMAKLVKKGQVISPVKLASKKIAATFWGMAWCDNLESYHDYESRLPRGRAYVRNGSVVDLQIAPRELRAFVAGSSLYKVTIDIGPLARKQWDAICRDCAGGIDSLVELLRGRFSKGVMERICRQGQGLFPRPSEIRFACSCPDWAYMCKHVAAVLYGVGARLDQKPELLFRLRAVDEKDLIARLDTALPLSKTGPTAGKVLEDEDISALFGLDMAVGEPAAKPVAKRGKAVRRQVGVAARGRNAEKGRTATPNHAPAATSPASGAKGGTAGKKVAGRKAVAVAPVGKSKAIPSGLESAGACSAPRVVGPRVAMRGTRVAARPFDAAPSRKAAKATTSSPQRPSTVVRPAAGKVRSKQTAASETMAAGKQMALANGRSKRR
jgi:uncharacterized Zn finger protein